MSNWKGVDAGKPALPSKQSNRSGAAKVDFGCDNAAAGKGSYKGIKAPNGALPKDRKAVISVGSIHDIKSDRKSNIGASPKG